MLNLTERPRRAVAECLGGAADSVAAVQYKLTDAGILGTLRALVGRGIEVRLLLDGHEAGSGRSLWRPLAQAGAEVRFWPTDVRGKLHARFAVVDGTRVLTGSNNWTTKGLDENIEIVTVLTDSTSVAAFEHSFQHLWDEGLPTKGVSG